MISFILNNELIHTDLPEGTPLVDFIRYEAALPGTKIGCREGDCGACTVLQGVYESGVVSYKSIVSCLTPLINAHGTHIVTVEGVNMKHLNPIQKSMVDNAATQCGFCTPGFVMSFTGYAMSKQIPAQSLAIASVSGNVCRCTGYKSIERAADSINVALADKNLQNPVKWLVDKQFLPDYFLQIPDRLAAILPLPDNFDGSIVMGGGTDLMVQKHDEIAESKLRKFQSRKKMQLIEQLDDVVTVGASCTADDMAHHPIMKRVFPKITDYIRLVSSQPIRNTGTIAGNFINASPIGDLSIFFLSLNAWLTLINGDAKRTVALKDFFIDYKKIDIRTSEFIETVHFKVPSVGFLFSYEKISKRTHLDIASVTSAICIEMKNGKIIRCGFSAGGVKAIPLYLQQTADFFVGKAISVDVLNVASDILQREISPISDVRGTESYKRLLLRQLMFAHFMELFPDSLDIANLL